MWHASLSRAVAATITAKLCETPRADWCAVRQSDNPAIAKHNAVAGTIAGQPFRMVSRAELPKHHPSRTSSPVHNTKTPAILEIRTGHCEKVAMLVYQNRPKGAAA